MTGTDPVGAVATGYWWGSNRQVHLQPLNTWLWFEQSDLFWMLLGCYPILPRCSGVSVESLSLFPAFSSNLLAFVYWHNKLTNLCYSDVKGWCYPKCCSITEMTFIVVRWTCCSSTRWVDERMRVSPAETEVWFVWPFSFIWCGGQKCSMGIKCEITALHKKYYCLFLGFWLKQQCAHRARSVLNICFTRSGNTVYFVSFGTPRWKFWG